MCQYLKRSFFIAPLIITAFFPVTSRAQYTSTFNQVSLIGEFNGWNTAVANTTLISNNVWQAYIDFVGAENPVFKFSEPGFTTAWGDDNQVNTNLPLDALAETTGGSPDILIGETVNGTLKFTLDDQSGRYTVTDVTPTTLAINTWINEVDYDQASTDTAEWIEIIGPAGTSLNGYEIRHINGANNAVLKTVNLTPLNFTFSDDYNGYGFFVLGRLPDGSEDFRPPGWDSNELQNSGEGVELRFNGTPVHVMAYEGGIITGANDPTSLADNSADNTTVYKTGGPGANFDEFDWANSTGNGSPGQVNPGQMFSTESPADVTFSNPINTPTFPTTNDAVTIEVDVVPTNGVSNLEVFLFYRSDNSQRYQPIAMTGAGNHYTSATAIPALPDGGLVEYYFFATFDGKGTRSPVIWPENGPANPISYGVSKIPPGVVWINEINAVTDIFEEDTNEYIEVVGLTGIDISDWTIEIFAASATPEYILTLPCPTVMGNDTNGFGILVLGDADVNGVDLILTNSTPDGTQLEESGAIRVKDESGATRFAYTYGELPPALPGFTHIGAEDFFDFGDQYLALQGTGSNAVNFTWTTNTTGSAGAVNNGQTLVGGNTAQLPPHLKCPPDVTVDSLANIPSPNIGSVQPVGLCGDLSVTVTHQSDVDNGGTGCYNDERIIVRTYMGVSDCSTTGFCEQVITVIDTLAPIIACPADITTECGLSAADDASQSVYSGGWADGANGGFGWDQGWILTASANSGHFTGSSAGNGGGDINGDRDIDTADKAWGMYAFSGGKAEALRNFPIPLDVGNTFSIDFDNGWIESGGKVLLALRDSVTTNARFTFSFASGTAEYQITDSAGAMNSGIGFTDQGMRLRFRLTSADTYTISITRLVDGITTDLSGTLAGPAGAPIDQLYVANDNAAGAVGGSQRDMFINNIIFDYLPPAAPELITVTDECPVQVTHVSDTSSGECPQIITRTYQAVDSSGNSTSCTQTITVTDTNAPEVVCSPDVTVETMVEVPTVSLDSVTTFDICGFVFVSYVGDTDNGGSGNAGDPFIITRTYLGVDECANSNTCSQIIHVEEGATVEAPTVVIQELDIGAQLSVASTGTNSWSLDLEYSTNLVEMPITWTALTVLSNNFVNGTNMTWYSSPGASIDYYFLRVLQESP